MPDEKGTRLEGIAWASRWTPLAAFPPSRRVNERVHACGAGVYLISRPDSAENPDRVRAVGWAKSDYWAERSWTIPFPGGLEPPPAQWHQIPSLAFLGKPDDLSFGSVRAFEQAQEGARKATLVTAKYRMTDGAFLCVIVKGAKGVSYLYGSNNPKAKDLPVAIEIELPGEPVEEVVIYRRPGAPPLD